MKGKLYSIVGLLIGASILLAACGGGVQTIVVTEIVEGEVVEVVVTAVPEGEGPELNTLYLNWGSEPPTADPQLGTDTTSHSIIMATFMGLTDQDNETKAVVPALATDWSSSEDKVTWTFNMRDDIPWVRFNPSTGEVEQVLDEEGNPRMTTAQDAVYGIKRLCDPRTASDYAYLAYTIKGCVELNGTDPAAEDFQEVYDAMGVEALDDFTVQVTSTVGASYIPYIVSMGNTYPIYEPVIEERGDRWIEPGYIVSNGAYVMEEWIHGDHLTLVQNPFWPEWAEGGIGTGNVERIVGYTIEEASTEMAMYENGEVDTLYGWGVPLDQTERVQTDPVLSQEYVNIPENCTYYYGFVTQRPTVADPNIRKALSMGIDRVTLVEDVLGAGQIPANSFTNPLNFGTVAGDTDIAPWALPEDMGGTGYEAAVEMGKDLLAEAGYPDGEGLDILLMHNVSEGHARIAQAIQAMWQEAYPGMTVSVETQEWRVYLETLEKDTDINSVPDVFRMGWCGDYPHANNWMHEVFNPDAGANRIRISEDDPYVGDLVAQYVADTTAAQVADDEEAKALYKDSEKLLVDEIVGIAPIYYYAISTLTKPYLVREYEPSRVHFWTWELNR